MLPRAGHGCVLRGGRAIPAGHVSTDPIALAESHWADHGWGTSAPGMRLVTTITRVQQLLHQRIDDILRPDLTFARYEILMLLSSGPACRSTRPPSPAPWIAWSVMA